MWKRARPVFAVVGLVFDAGVSHAAGGHFDVDDATVLDPGHCQYETWLARLPAAETTVVHFGPGCRVGPVEIGVNFDRLRSDESRTSVGPQLKMVADPLMGRLSAGVAWNASFDITHGGRPWQSFYVPLTWWAADKLWVHVNAGADWAPSGAQTRRIGVSGEWAASDKLSVLAERVTFYRDWVSRVGARFNLNDSISVDFSAARVGPKASRMYVLGLNHDFAR